MANKTPTLYIDDPIAVGNRIKSTRMLTGHTRCSFAFASGISSATLRFWEEPPPGRHGLTKKGAERLINAFNTCGISCAEEWLLFGKGFGPKLINTSLPMVFDEEDQKLWSEEEAILKDVESFKNNNHHSIIFMIADKSMCPIYNQGDYVGGTKKYSYDINDLIGLNCIVETFDSVLVRKIIAGETNDTFSLIALNSDKEIVDSFILNIKLKSAAEIVFHRWRQSSNSKR